MFHSAIFSERENFHFFMNFLKGLENNLFIVTNDLKQNRNDDWTWSFMYYVWLELEWDRNGKLKICKIFLRKNNKEVYYWPIIS